MGTKDFACDYTYATPCPQAAGAQVVPSRSPPVSAASSCGSGTERATSRRARRSACMSAGALNGSPASAAARLTAAFVRNRRSELTVGYGRRATVRGRLVDAAGTPIAGAAIQVLDRQARTGTAYGLRGEVTTGLDGRFSLLPGVGPARLIRFEYRARRQLAAPSAVDRVGLQVRAGVTLSIRPRRVGPSGSIRLSGRLKGGPLPRSGSCSICKRSTPASGGRSRRCGRAGTRASRRAIAS